MESKFSYNIKKHIFICDYEKLWIKLSIGCVISFFIIIRGCSIPVISNNMIMKWLFCSSNSSDKTFYSIAISYLAAYIFYLLQVYLPERSRTNRILTITALHAYNFINQVRRFIYVWNNIAEKTSDGEIMHIKNIELYYKDNIYQNICRADINELKLIVQRLVDEYKKIIDTPEFQFVDLEIYKIFKEYDFETKIEKLYMLLIGADVASRTGSSFYETYSTTEIENILTKLDVLCSIYGFERQEFNIVNDIEEIDAWKKEQEYFLKELMRNEDFFQNLPEEYFNTIKR